MQTIIIATFLIIRCEGTKKCVNKQILATKNAGLHRQSLIIEEKERPVQIEKEESMRPPPLLMSHPSTD